MPRRVWLKSLSGGLPMLRGTVELRAGERELLHPLFVALRDRRALLDAPHGREDQPYVTESIEEIRVKLSETLSSLHPDSEASPWIEKMRTACREYLDAVAASRRSNATVDFEDALAQLRTGFRTVALHVSAVYKLPAAAQLVDEMDKADRERPAAISASVVNELPAAAQPVNEEGKTDPKSAVSTVDAVLGSARSVNWLARDSKWLCLPCWMDFEIDGDSTVSRSRSTATPWVPICPRCGVSNTQPSTWSTR